MVSKNKPSLLSPSDAALWRKEAQRCSPLASPQYRIPAAAQLKQLPADPSYVAVDSYYQKMEVTSSSKVRQKSDPWTVSKKERRKISKLDCTHKVDLHGFYAEKAIEYLESRIRNALACGIRSMMVIHGKGINSKDGPVLKPKVRQYLEQHRYVYRLIDASSGGAVQVYFFKKAFTEE